LMRENREDKRSEGNCADRATRGKALGGGMRPPVCACEWLDGRGRKRWGRRDGKRMTRLLRPAATSAMCRMAEAWNRRPRGRPCPPPLLQPQGGGGGTSPVEKATGQVGGRLPPLPSRGVEGGGLGARSQLRADFQRLLRRSPQSRGRPSSPRRAPAPGPQGRSGCRRWARAAAAFTEHRRSGGARMHPRICKQTKTTKCTNPTLVECLGAW